MGQLFLTSKELADRWRLSDQTLANWRHARTGPPYVRVGGKPLYRLGDVEAYEAENSHCLSNQSTSNPALHHDDRRIGIDGNRPAR
jgi:hypothetical protein